ncbi:hypothetical protein SAMN04487934_106118 [Eubacterium ruminantium]|nr:hypothetical protein SAMN04487934_106118 [Eubacterium ruminantium]
MALKYPLLAKIGIPVLILLVVLLHIIKKKVKYKGGIRAANTSFARNLPEYKKFKKRHSVLKTLMEISAIVAIGATIILFARPYKVEKVVSGTKKRDIYLNLDVSYSICYLNYDLVDSLRDVVKSLDGDRFGITIYNTSTVLYVPMTDDYDFILRKLDDLKEYFELQKEYVENYWGKYLYEVDQTKYQQLQEKLDYFDAGTITNNIQKGSSLIGEGLASCLYSFPHLEDENRTRVIIMSTDNAEEARQKPLVELDEASDLCEKNGVTIFGIFPNEKAFNVIQGYEYDYEENSSDMQYNVEKTGGKFYKQSDSFPVSEIVKDIQEQKVMEVNEIVITKSVDQPMVPVVIILISLIILIITGAVILL